MPRKRYWDQTAINRYGRKGDVVTDPPMTRIPDWKRDYPVKERALLLLSVLVKTLVIHGAAIPTGEPEFWDAFREAKELLDEVDRDDP